MLITLMISDMTAMPTGFTEVIAVICTFLSLSGGGGSHQRHRHLRLQVDHDQGDRGRGVDQDEGHRQPPQPLGDQVPGRAGLGGL